MNHSTQPTRLFRHSLVAAAVLGSAALAACDAGPGQSEGYVEEDAWNAVAAQRNAEVDAYLQDNAVAFAWFKDNPIGFSGIPYVSLRVMTNMDEFSDIWPSDNLGLFPHPDDYVDGVLKPAHQRKHRLPLGMAYRDPQMDGVFNGTNAIDKVFFSCGGCHTGRVNVPAEDGSPRIMHIFGAPNTEIDAQVYTKALMETGERLASDAKLASLVESNIDHWDNDFFYDDTTYAWKEKTAVDLLWGTVLDRLEEGAQKARLIYQTLPNAAGSYRGLSAFGPRIGQMDAYGIAAGLVVLHTQRNEYFEKMPSDHPFFDGLEHLSGDDKYEAAGERLRQSAAEWLPQKAAPVDIASLYVLDDRHHAGWDANQGATARVIASGTSAVGDPSKLNLPNHQMMNEFASQLPAPAYPFAVDMELAAAGQPIFEQQCAGCHQPRNSTVYTVEQLGGIDRNRADVLSPTARLGLIALMRESCQGEDWCQAAGETVAEQDNEYLREIRPEAERGYKADVLHGIWSTAPYLHNGSVPTLWHLLNPSERPEKFVRGNINYDTEMVGFVWDEAPVAGSYDNVRWAYYDTRDAGRSNQGHTFGAQLTPEEKTALIEYLKTL